MFDCFWGITYSDLQRQFTSCGLRFRTIYKGVNNSNGSGSFGLREGVTKKITKIEELKG